MKIVKIVTEEQQMTQEVNVTVSDCVDMLLAKLLTVDISKSSQLSITVHIITSVTKVVII